MTDEPELHCGTVKPASSGGACVLLHGGAWNIPRAEWDAHLEGMRQALDRGKELLSGGAPALEAVTETVAAMEANGAFDAGRGGVLTRDGSVELDAGMMDGATLDFGAVACVRRVADPIRLAGRVLRQSTGEMRLLVGEGAERFAADQGFELVENSELICERERRRFDHLRREAERYHTSHPFLPRDGMPMDTVGCLARDRRGRLAAATSTGGTPFSPAGRVGDSPLPGAGYYANHHAAAGATGWGEAIAAMLLSVRAVDGIAAGKSADSVVRERLIDMHRSIRNHEGEGATGGLILLDRDGHGAWAFTTPRMARAGWAEGASPWAEI